MIPFAVHTARLLRAPLRRAAALLAASAIGLSAPALSPACLVLEEGQVRSCAAAEMKNPLLPLRAEADALSPVQPMLEAGQSVTVQRRGQTQMTTARHETVGDLLRRLNIPVDRDDMAILEPVGDRLFVRVSDYYLHTRTETTVIPCAARRVEDPALPQGTETVVQEGRDGQTTATYLDLYLRGQLRRTDLLYTDTEEAVEEVIAYGTDVPPEAEAWEAPEENYAEPEEAYVEEEEVYAEEAEVYEEEEETSATDTEAYDEEYAQEVSAPAQAGGGVLTFSDGTTAAYSSVMTCGATAYAIHGYTASGYPTEMGAIAVDPTVIPYGTRMYIETTDGSWVYGLAVARDCGSDIIGNRIDLWFPDYDTACDFGFRDCNVYFLE